MTLLLLLFKFKRLERETWRHEQSWDLVYEVEMAREMGLASYHHWYFHFGGMGGVATIISIPSSLIVKREQP